MHIRRTIGNAVTSWLLFVVAAWLLPNSRPGYAQPTFAPETMLPADTKALVSFPNLAASRERLAKTALHDILHDEAVRDALGPLMPRIDGVATALKSGLAEAVGLQLTDLDPLLSGGVALALLDFDTKDRSHPVDVAVLVQPADGKAFDAVLEKAVGKRDRHVFAGTEVQTARVRGRAVHIAAANGVRIITSRRSAMEKIIGLTRKEGADSLASSATFKQAMREVEEKGRDLRVYVNVRAIAAQLEPSGRSRSSFFVGLTGIGAVEAIGVGASFEGKGIADAVYVHAPGERRGLIKLLSADTADKRLLAYVPKNAAKCAIGRLDIGQLWGEIGAVFARSSPREHNQFVEGVKQFEAMVGINLANDIFAAMGDGLVVYATDSPAQARTWGFGQLVIMLTVKDKTKIESAIAKLTQFAASSSHGRAIWQRSQHREIAVHSLNDGGRSPVAPAYAVTDKFLIVGLSAQSVREAIDQLADPTDNITKAPNFVRAASYVPKDYGALKYTDEAKALAALARAVDGTLAPLLRLGLFRSGGPQQGTLGFAPLATAAGKHLFGSVATLKSDEKGIRIDGYSPLGAHTGPTAVPALAAAAFLPRMFHARSSARRAVCKSNLKQLGLAIIMYSNDYNEHYPLKLADLFDQYITARKVFACPEDSNPVPIGNGIRCSYRYLGGLPITTDPQVMIAYERTANHRMKGRNALFYDGHVEWISETRLAERLKRSYELVKKSPPTPKPADYDKRVEEFFCLRADPVEIRKAFEKCKTPEVAVRKRAVDSLLDMPTGGLREALSEALEDPNPNVRSAAAYALGRLRDAQAADALRRAFNDADAAVGQNAAVALGQLGPADAKLLDLIAEAAGSETTLDRDAAYGSLAKAGDKRAAPGLVRMLETGDTKAKRFAAETLGRLGDKSAASALLTAAEQKDVRPWVGLGLSRLGHEDGVPILVESLKHEDAQIRAWAAEALGTVPNKPAIPALVAALKDDELAVHDAAAATLKGIDNQRARDALGKDPLRRVTQLMNDLKARDYQTQRNAQEELAEIGRPAVPILIEALGDRDYKVTNGAATALSKMKDPFVAEKLLSAIRAGRFPPQSRHQLQNVLQRLGRPVALVLIKALKDENRSVRQAAASALGSTRAPEAIAPLMEAMNDGDATVAANAARALAMVPSEEAFNGLVGALRDQERSTPVRAAAAGALGMAARYQRAVPIGQGPSSAGKAVAALIDALADPNAAVRSSAANVLSGIRTPEARSALRRSAQSKDEQIRTVARQALQRACANNLNQLRYPCQNYANQSGPKGLYPAKLTDLVTRRLVHDKNVLLCPADGGPKKTAKGYEVSYDSAFDLTDKRLPKDFPKDAIMIWEREPRHNDMRHVLRFNGRVTLVVDAEFQTDLKRLKDLIEKHGTEDPFAKKPVAELIAQLKTRDYQTRRSVQFALADRANAAVPSLIDALRDQDHMLSDGARQAVVMIGGEVVVKALIEALRQTDEQNSSRHRIEQALRETGKTAVPVMMKALEDSSVLVRRAAASGLGSSRAKEAVGPLTKALQDPDQQVRWNAALALGSMKTEKAIGVLLAALGGADAKTRAPAAMALGNTRSASAVVPLVNALRDRDRSVRSAAASALAMIKGPDAVKALSDALADADSRTRPNIANALASINTKEARRPLLEALKAQDASLRAAASKALGRTRAKEALQPLVEALNDSDKTVRAAAAGGLAMMAKPQRGQEPQLSSSDRAKTSEALEALKKNENAISAVIDALGDRDYTIRQGATALLAQMGDARIVSELLERYRLAGRQDYQLRSGIESTLRKMGKATVPRLIEALQHQDARVRQLAAGALRDSKAPEALPALVRALGDTDANVRSRAASAISAMKSKEAKDALLKGLKDDDPKMRGAAAQALGYTRSSDAVVPLIATLKDDDSNVRRYAASALGMIQTKEAMGALIEALNSGAASAAQALANRPEPAALDALKGALKSEAASVRQAVAQALANTARSAAYGRTASQVARRTAALEALVNAFGNPDPQVVRAARQGLAWRRVRSSKQYAAAVAEALLAGLKHKNAQVRDNAADLLAEYEDSKLPKRLVKLLGGEDERLRTSARNVLEAMPASRSSQPLLAGMKDPNPAIRADAAYVLGQAGSRQALLALRSALKDEDACVRNHAAVAVAKLGGDIPDLADLLKAATHDAHSHIRVAAGRALAKAGGASAVAVFVTMLKSGSAAEQFDAINMLARSKDPSAGPALASALKADDAMVRARAALALADRKEPTTVQPLIDALADADPKVGPCAASALGKIGDKAAAPHLLRVVEDEQNPVRPWAGLALYRLGERTAGLEAMTDALKAENPKFRAWAAQALGIVRAREAASALNAALDDPDTKVRGKAIEALAKIGGSAAVPALIRRLETADAQTRRELVTRLSELGEPSVVPKLIQMARHDDSMLRSAISTALGQIGNSEIYVMNVDGSGFDNLTRDPGSDFAPAWSPDGKRIVFVSSRDGNSEIHAMNADGSDVARLTRSTSTDDQPDWSPDGDKIAFRSKRDGNYEIYVMDADGTEQTNLTRNRGHDYGPTWSPDGKRIAFASRRSESSGIYVMNADGTGLWRVADTSSSDTYPAWSPDGKKIAFQSRRDGDYEVYVVNADGTSPVNVSRAPGHDYNPCWSPDGKRVAFDSRREQGSWICTVSLDGSDLQRITIPNASCTAPAWSPDGKRFALCVSRYVGGDGLPLVVEAAQDENRYVRAYAMMTLARSMDWSVVPLLAEAMSDGHAEVRQWAAYGLGRLGDKSVAPLLRKALQDSDSNVRRNAQRALRSLGVGAGGRR